MRKRKKERIRRGRMHEDRGTKKKTKEGGGGEKEKGDEEERHDCML